MRLQEIEKRLAQIKEDLEKDGADLDALEKEVRALNEEKAKIIADEQRRQEIRERVGAGEGVPVDKPAGQQEQKAYTAADKEYRTAWAKTLMFMPLSKEERQAIADVNHRSEAVPGPLTSTATDFVAQTDTIIGQNNAGLFIPQYVSDKLLEQIALDSPLLAAVAKSAVAGMVSYPYKVTGDPAKWRQEGIANDLEAIEWASMTLYQKELSKTIRITWKIEAMTPDSFVDYIIRELRIEMTEALAASVPYGSGDKDLRGMNKTNLTVEYSEGANLIDTLVRAGLKIPKKKRAGAKLYISMEMATEIALAKDSHGDYILPPINGAGISKIGPYSVEVDPYLEPDDFFLGNLSRGYILNEVENTSITKDVMARSRVNDYTAYGIWGGNVVPDTIVYGTKEEDEG